MSNATSVKTASGLEKIVISHQSGSSAEVYCFGATTTSFLNANQTQILFLSEKSLLDGSKPIRGGIPLVFPYFGSDPDHLGPNHGFARTCVWTFRPEETTTTDEEIRVRFELKPDPNTLQTFPFQFMLIYQVSLSKDSLGTSLSVLNKETDKSFDFQALLHTYLKLHQPVESIDKVSLSGLHQIGFYDKLTGTKEMETRQQVQITQETDRIYTPAPGQMVMTTNSGTSSQRETSIRLAASNQTTCLPVDVVVWNPWIDKAKSMGDFKDEEYEKMICIEPGLVSSFTTLNAGETIELKQLISTDITTCT